MWRTLLTSANNKMSNQDNYIMDKKETLFYNLPWILFVLMWIIFTTMSLSITASISDETIKVIALLGTLFCVFKFASWNGFPTIRLKKVISLNESIRLKEMEKKK